MRFRLAAALLLVTSGVSRAGDYVYPTDPFGGGVTYGRPTYRMPAWRERLKRRLDPWAFDPNFDPNYWDQMRRPDGDGYMYRGGESGYFGPDRSLRSVRGW